MVLHTNWYQQVPPLAGAGPSDARLPTVVDLSIRLVRRATPRLRTAPGCTGPLLHAWLEYRRALRAVAGVGGAGSSNDARARTLRLQGKALPRAALYGDNARLVPQNSDCVALFAAAGPVARIGKAARAKTLGEFDEKIVIKRRMALNRELLHLP